MLISIVDTGTNGWQRRMDTLMKKKERFLVITTDQRTVYTLLNRMKLKSIKRILFGGGVIAGIGWGIKFAWGGVILSTALFLLAEMDPLLRMVCISIPISILLAGTFWMFRFIHNLLGGGYVFKLREKNSLGEWIIRGEPRLVRIEMGK